MDEIKEKMQKALDHLQEELSALRTNRPSPSILDNVKVEVYGTQMRIRDLASISVVDGRQLLVSPFDPQTASVIGKGIEKANLNLQPIVEGNLVRIPFPDLSGELRDAIVKEAKDKTEKTKITIRDYRRKGNDLVKKQKADGEISEDEKDRLEKKIQESTDEFCKKADKIYVSKEKDILSV